MRDTQPIHTDSQSPLFATEPVATGPLQPPVIVVGLPRSGSSFLAYVLSCIDEWYVFDDLYIYQKVAAIGAKQGPMSKNQFEELIDYLGWQLRARIKYVEFDPPRATWEDVDRMNEALRYTFSRRPITWTQLLEEWMTRLAHHHGRSRWGYKVPQDFLHATELNRHFPGTRFILIYRDPRKMMSSLKYVHATDGHPWQYHPLIYTKYWKMALRTMDRVAGQLPGQVCVVKFEQLIADPTSEAQRLAGFLGSDFDGQVRQQQSNTSFQDGKRKTITPTETWLCEKIAGRVMIERGYALEGATPHLRDMFDFLWVTIRFGIYQFKRMLISKRSRKQIVMFLRAMFSHSS